MANSIRPDNFPEIIAPLDGTEELYSQTGGVNSKFTTQDVLEYVTGQTQVLEYAAYLFQTGTSDPQTKRSD